MRGKDHRRTARWLPRGITPAYAGKSKFENYGKE